MKKYSKLIGLIVLVVVALCLPAEMWSQCPMCRMSAESNLANGGQAGKGLNRGIFYLLGMPYLIVGTIAFVWYRNNRLRKNEELASHHSV